MNTWTHRTAAAVVVVTIGLVLAPAAGARPAAEPAPTATAGPPAPRVDIDRSFALHLADAPR